MENLKQMVRDLEEHRTCETTLTNESDKLYKILGRAKHVCATYPSKLSAKNSELSKTRSSIAALKNSIKNKMLSCKQAGQQAGATECWDGANVNLSPPKTVASNVAMHAASGHCMDHLMFALFSQDNEIAKEACNYLFGMTLQNIRFVCFKIDFFWLV